MAQFNQPSATPSAKIAAVGVSGAITVVLVYLVNQFTGVDIPGEVAAALTLLFSFAGGYFKRENA